MNKKENSNCSGTEQLERVNDMVSGSSKFEYEIIRSNRRTIAITVLRDSKVLVKAPMRYPLEELEKFVDSKERWILEKQSVVRIKQHNHAEAKKLSAGMLNQNGITYRETARNAIVPRVVFYAKLMQVHFNGIRIKEQKSRWGSCSSKGNLNFNWRLVLMPQEVLDYVVVHELCHLRHMNHSREFWAYVEEIMPDYRRWKKWLKEY